MIRNTTTVAAAAAGRPPPSSAATAAAAAAKTERTPLLSTTNAHHNNTTNNNNNKGGGGGSVGSAGGGGGTNGNSSVGGGGGDNGPRQRRGGGVGGGGIESQHEENYNDDEHYFLSATPFVPPSSASRNNNEDERSKDRRGIRGYLKHVTSTVSSFLPRNTAIFSWWKGNDDEEGGAGGMASFRGGDDDYLSSVYGVEESSVVQKSEKKKYYRDDFNDQSWECTFGTNEDDGIWMNRKDQAGTIMAFLVWVLIVYSGVTVTLLARTNKLSNFLAMSYCTICALSLSAHAKTTFTDPGAVPISAVPVESIHQRITFHAMCSQCQTFKPPQCHHCRICNRCISRMDHHCPWMNNCIGAANMKHFILFLIYTWLGSAYALLIFGWNYFLCTTEECTFSPVLIQLVRAMTLLCFTSLLFTSSMIMNVTYGIMTGIGTIDRLKKKANDTVHESDEEPIPLVDIFGVAGYWSWCLPIDPVFEDYDHVMGYSTPQRLLREEMMERNSSAGGGMYSPGPRDFAPV